MAPPAVPPYTLNTLYACNPQAERGIAVKLHVHKDNIIYSNGRTVIIRDLKDPSVAKSYVGHAKAVTVARYSPSGFYCASADVGGTVRVWDTLGEENVLKGEYSIFTGKINDLAWDGESKRIVAGGAGRERFVKAFTFDIGNSVGNMVGHVKPVNAVSVRPQRPYRAVSSGDDHSIYLYSAPPYKYEKRIETHTNFVQDVKYSPSGAHFASAGSDRKVFLYDGSTGELLGELRGEVHSASVMAMSWSPDSKKFVTSSLDKTVKLWDVETKQTIRTWTLGTDIQHQQVGNAWSENGDIVSLSLSGNLNIFDERESKGPTRLLLGPVKSVTSATLASLDTFFIGSSDGRVLSVDLPSKQVSVVSGNGHTSLISGMSPIGSSILSVGFDDTLRELDAREKSMTQALTKTQAQPKGLATSEEGTAFIAEIDGIEAIRDNQSVMKLNVKYQPHSVATTGSVVAVGGDDSKVHLYTWDGKTLEESGSLGARGTVTALAFTPGGNLLAAGDSSGKIILFSVADKKAIESTWTNHAARINSVSWSADGKHLASGSLDAHAYVWSVEKPGAYLAIRHAAPGGVNSVVWLEATKLVTAGADACIRVWEVKQG